MKLSQDKPIFEQVAEILENQILEGELRADEQVPSTNDFAKVLNMNPATARKGMNLLVDEEILYKKRGMGMFVEKDALDKILQRRKSEFFKVHIPRLLEETERLGISSKELIDEINRQEGGQ